MVNIWQNDTRSLPTKKADDQIVRVPMDQSEIAGRKSHLPNASISPEMSIVHVPNRG